MRAEETPRISPAEVNTILTGIPIPVVRVTTEAISRAVIAVITEVSLIVAVVARRLQRISLSNLFT